MNCFNEYISVEMRREFDVAVKGIEIIESIKADLGTVFETVNKELKQCCNESYDTSKITKKIYYNLKLKMLDIDMIIRPAMVISSSRMFYGPKKKTISLAALIQLIFVASRVHSLVAEEKEIKMSSLWRQYLVLVGDYIYSRSYKLMYDTGLNCFLDQMAAIIDKMNDGGIVAALNPAAKIEIIRKETAELFGGACSMGAALGQSTKQEQELLRAFGHTAGMVYGMNERAFKYEEIREYMDEAFNILSNLPDSPQRELMEQLLYVCAGRKLDSSWSRCITLPA